MAQFGLQKQQIKVYLVFKIQFDIYCHKLGRYMFSGRYKNIIKS